MRLAALRPAHALRHRGFPQPRQRRGAARAVPRGIDILAGFIVGFDRDTPGTFAEQRRLILDSGIVVAMVGLLTSVVDARQQARLTAARPGRLQWGLQ